MPVTLHLKKGSPDSMAPGHQPQQGQPGPPATRRNWLRPGRRRLRTVALEDTHPVFLLSLQLLHAFQQASLGPVQIRGKASDGDDIGLQFRRRHVDVHLHGDRRDPMQTGSRPDRDTGTAGCSRVRAGRRRTAPPRGQTARGTRERSCPTLVPGERLQIMVPQTRPSSFGSRSPSAQ